MQVNPYAPVDPRPRFRGAFSASKTAHHNRLIASPSSQSSLRHMCKRSDTIDFSTVYSNQEVSEIFSLAIKYPNDHYLADDAVNCVPLLVDGSRRWLGYSNISNGVIGKFVKVLRKHRSRSSFCVTAMSIIIALCADKKVTHDPNIQRFSDVSAIKVITLVLNQHLVTNVAKKQRYSVFLRLIAKRWQSMNIDDNIQNTIFSYLYSQKQNDSVVELCCQAMIVFASSGLLKVQRKISATSGCCEALVDVLKSATTVDSARLGLQAIEMIGVTTNGAGLVMCGFFEAVIPVLKTYIHDLLVVQTGLLIISNLLDSTAYSSGQNKSLFVASCTKILGCDGCDAIMSVVTAHMNDPVVSTFAWKIVRRMLTRCTFCLNRPQKEIRSSFNSAGIEGAFNTAKEVHKNDEDVMNELLIFVSYSFSDNVEDDESIDTAFSGSSGCSEGEYPSREYPSRQGYESGI